MVPLGKPDQEDAALVFGKALAASTLSKQTASNRETASGNLLRADGFKNPLPIKVLMSTANTSNESAPRPFQDHVTRLKALKVKRDTRQVSVFAIW